MIRRIPFRLPALPSPAPAFRPTMTSAATGRRPGKGSLARLLLSLRPKRCEEPPQTIGALLRKHAPRYLEPVVQPGILPDAVERDHGAPLRIVAAIDHARHARM